MAHTPADPASHTPEAARAAAELTAAQDRETRLRAAHEFYAAELEHDRVLALRGELELLRGAGPRA
ncbi:hypothetical protein ADK55_25265 [Streptomyces sp. WM4235]|uniref:hypothetical protein n=1 Tax=unclassified Streptomyces TaxID=2593676 RepID=UPI0006AF863C|nr:MULTISPECIES: hypothetical protein [unclassified Streptomyces]KOU42301.1 hypothetical protein ADK55_25265 [Streptomyces sp. WM4235]MCX5076997.1 hypothetical protein [Streptomyces sp. NBC_00424]WUD39999.1 hypothetical protein OHA84_05495 [Streptomyces sp. NBC_00513]